MNKKALTSLAIAGTIIAFGSCYKNEKKEPVYTSLGNAIASLVPTSKTVDMDAATGGSFRGNSGARYEFPANAFITATGTPVTGTVKIEVTEYLSKSDMMFSGVLPVIANESLISGGEFYVNATKDGQTLFMRHGTTYAVNLPQKGTPISGMMAFQGHENIISGGIVWVPKHDSTIALIVYNGDTIRLFNDSLGYGNADRFMSNPIYQTFDLSLSTSDGAPVPTANNIGGTAAVSASCLYDEFNGVWGMSYAGNSIVREDHVPNIPVHFVVTALIDGQFYGGILGTTPTTGSTYNVVLKPTTPAAFKALVDVL